MSDEPRYNQEGYRSPVVDQVQRDINQWKSEKATYNKVQTARAVIGVTGAALVAYGVAGLAGLIK